MMARRNLAFALLVPLSIGGMVIGCSRTPRSAPPSQIGLASSDLQKTSDCILAGIRKGESDPTITTSVKDMAAGKVEEIIGTSSDAGELYVIRLTSESDGTKAEAFSVISWNKFKESYLKKVLAPCVTHFESQPPGPQSESQKQPRAHF